MAQVIVLEIQSVWLAVVKEAQDKDRNLKKFFREGKAWYYVERISVKGWVALLWLPALYAK